MDIEYHGLRTKYSTFELDPYVDGDELVLPATTIINRAGTFEMPEERLPLKEGDLFLDGDGEYHWFDKGTMTPYNPPKALPPYLPVHLLWINGDRITVLRSVRPDEGYELIAR